MKKAITYKLDPILYMHPGDRAMLTKLEKMSVVANLLGAYNDFFCRQVEIQIMGSGIHVTPKSLPKLYRTYQEVCDFFGVENPPHLYLNEDPTVNAFAMGADRAFIVIHEGMLFKTNEIEQKYLLGHELAHVMAGHVKYKYLIYELMSLGGPNSIPFGGILKDLADLSFMPLLMLWSRRSEYTCDRAGMLAAQKKEAAYSFFMKISGLPINYREEVNPEVIVDQAEEFQQVMSSSLIDTYWAARNQLYSTHPRSIERAAEIKEWIDEGWYEEIVNGNEKTRAELARVMRADPADAEMRMLITRTVIAWAMKQFGLSREEAAAPIRKALYYNQSLRNTAVERLLKMELSITPMQKDKIEYILSLLFVDNNWTPQQVNIRLPIAESADYAGTKIREQFIRNGNKPVVISLYSVEESR